MLTALEKKELEFLRAKKDAENFEEKDKARLDVLEAKAKAAPTVEYLEQQAGNLVNDVQHMVQNGRPATDDTAVKTMEAAVEAQKKEIAKMSLEMEAIRSLKTVAPLEAPDKKSGGGLQYSAKAIQRQITMPSFDPVVNQAQNINDDLVIAATLMSMCSTNKSDRKAKDVEYRAAIERFKQHPYFADQIVAMPQSHFKTLYSTGTLSGDEFVPTDLSAQMIEVVNQLCGLDTKFDLVRMPTNPFDVPAATSHSTVSILAEPTTDTDTKIIVSNPATAKITLTTKTLGFRNDWTEELDEDSIIAMLPFLRRDGAKSISIGLEDALINGDTSTPHQDTDVTVATDVRKAWKGLRKLARDRSGYATSLATLNAENLRKIRKTMGKYGVNPKELIYLCGIIGHNLLLSLKDSSGNPIVQTIDKFGAAATWLTGYLSAIDGAPLLITEKVRENLAATGLYDGSTTTKGIILCAYQPGFIQGEKRSLTIRAVEKPEYDKIWLIFSMRRDFQARYGTSDVIVAGGINLDCS